jgi:hypothetical protein
MSVSAGLGFDVDGPEILVYLQEVLRVRPMGKGDTILEGISIPCRSNLKRDLL